MHVKLADLVFGPELLNFTSVTTKGWTTVEDFEAKLQLSNVDEIEFFEHGKSNWLDEHSRHLGKH